MNSFTILINRCYFCFLPRYFDEKKNIRTDLRCASLLISRQTFPPPRFFSREIAII